MKIRGFGPTAFGFLLLVSTSICAQTFYDGGDKGPSQSGEPEEDIVQVVPRYPSAPPAEPALKPLLRVTNPFAYVVYETDSELNFEEGNGVRFVKGQMFILARKDLGVSVGDFVAEMKRGSTLWITGDIRGDVEIVNLDDDKMDAVRLSCLLPGETQMRVLAPSQTLRLRQGQLDWTATDLGTFWLDSLFFQEMRDRPKDRFEQKLIYALARGAGVSGRMLTPTAPVAPVVETATASESTVEPLKAVALEMGEKPKKATPSELLSELDSMGAKKKPGVPAPKKGPAGKTKPAVLPKLVAQKAQLDFTPPVVKPTPVLVANPAMAPVKLIPMPAYSPDYEKNRPRVRRRAYSTLDSYRYSLRPAKKAKRRK